jgi:lipopolysaccharide/colanic/teichoic acid biosynthesis glycosyltransferase
LKKQVIGFIADSIIILFSFYLFVWLRFGTVFAGPLLYKTSAYFFGIFIFLSLFANKNKVLQKKELTSVLYPIALSNLIILTIFILLGRFVFPFTEYRFTSLYAVILASFMEIIAGLFYVILSKSAENPYTLEQFDQEKTTPPFIPQDLPSPKSTDPDPLTHNTYVNLSNIIIEETSPATLEFISPYFTASASESLIISTTTTFNLLIKHDLKYKTVINLKRINDIKYLNKFFEAVNAKLERGGIFIDWVETKSLRKKRILSKYPNGTNYLIYSIDFIFHRILPKLPVGKNIYFFITRGHNRVLSKAETFGRLYSCGFEIIQEQFIGSNLFFAVRKVKDPVFDNNPTYGPLIKLKRLGKDGKIIGVYKLRTMHAYSEYLQGYVFQQNSLQSGGKFKDDFRVTTLGKIFRKFWIDELPMIINILKGDLKLVGVRPLSQHYFSLYSEALQKQRIKHKPGLVPPFYADLPGTLDEIMESEMKYLESYEKHPFTTDVKYFFKALYNILIKRARSN